MKNIKFLILFIAIALINCERDDICAATTQTTPRLIIEFYDAIETEDLKNVPRLTVYGDGLFTDEDGIVTEPTDGTEGVLLEISDSGVESYVFNVNKNKIALPLIIDEVPQSESITTRFILEKETNLRVEDDDLTTNSNKDILEIKYNTEFVYVSRACGYKSIFTNLEVRIDTSDDSELWIANIQIEESIELTVENENTTHVRIFH